MVMVLTLCMSVYIKEYILVCYKSMYLSILLASNQLPLDKSPRLYTRAHVISYLTAHMMTMLLQVQYLTRPQKPASGQRTRCHHVGPNSEHARSINVSDRQYHTPCVNCLVKTNNTINVSSNMMQLRNKHSSSPSQIPSTIFNSKISQHDHLFTNKFITARSAMLLLTDGKDDWQCLVTVILLPGMKWQTKSQHFQSGTFLLCWK